MIYNTFNISPKLVKSSFFNNVYITLQNPLNKKRRFKDRTNVIPLVSVLILHRSDLGSRVIILL